MTRTTVILVLLLLAGCARAIQVGQPGRYLVECDGAAIPLSVCYKKAARLCPRGYDVVDKERVDGNIVGGMEHKNITVQCK